MIVKQKMRTAGKIFGKICLRNRDTFLSNMVCDQGRDGVRPEGMWRNQFFGGGDIQQKGKVQTFGHKGGTHSLSLCGKSWSAHKEHPEECAWSTNYNDFEMSERVFSFKATNLEHVRLKEEKEVAKFLMVFNLRKIIHPFQGEKYLRT